MSKVLIVDDYPDIAELLLKLKSYLGVNRPSKTKFNEKDHVKSKKL